MIFPGDIRLLIDIYFVKNNLPGEIFKYIFKDRLNPFAGLAPVGIKINEHEIRRRNNFLERHAGK